MDKHFPKKRSLEKKLSNGESPESKNNTTLLNKPKHRPDVCPDVTHPLLANILEPDVVRSSSSSSGNSSRVSSFTSSSSSERSSLAVKPIFSQNSLDEENSTTIPENAIHDITKLKKKGKMLAIYMTQYSNDDNVFEVGESYDTLPPFLRKKRTISDSSPMSEKGRRTRSEFCSSGYGTGSAGSRESTQGNSLSKLSADLAQEKENETINVAAATPITFKPLSLSSIENDFKPKMLNMSSFMKSTTLLDQKDPMVLDQNEPELKLLPILLNQKDPMRIDQKDRDLKLLPKTIDQKDPSPMMLDSNDRDLKVFPKTLEKKDLSPVLLDQKDTDLKLLSMIKGQKDSLLSDQKDPKWMFIDKPLDQTEDKQNSVKPSDTILSNFNYQEEMSQVSKDKIHDNSLISLDKLINFNNLRGSVVVNEGSSLLTRNVPLSSGSVSSGSSYYIPSSDESRLHASHMFTESVFKNVFTSLNLQGSSVSSQETRYQLDDLLQSSTRHQAELDSYFHQAVSTSSIDNDLANILEKSARCEEETCGNEQCYLIKYRIKELADGHIQIASLTEDQRSLLYHMYMHVKDCTLPICTFYWCSPSLNIESLSEANSLITMKKKIENFTDDKVLDGIFLDYLKISPHMPYEKMPVEREHWSRLCMLDNSSRAMLVKPNSAECQDYWVIKKNPVDDDYLWQVCTKLCKLKHSSVIQILWAARFDCHVLICSQFEAGYFTLQDSLRACTPSGFDSGITQILMLQLSSAAKHLNNLGILYLNWTSGNILSYQSDQGIVVKLSNFSAAACIDYYDVGFLQLVLPTNILMPELCNDDKVTATSDVWGLGCILYELVTGHPIWHLHRHITSEELKKIMKYKYSTLSTEPEYNLIYLYPKMSPLLSACWQVDPNKRISIIDLQVQLIEVFLSSNPRHPT
ncbi:hypothetical protein Bpfe_011489 [Biomphalaria pfeifferi]|uniref:Protein kinase domain-containing protein n=1 Tax=Biomphalaria pfeifferi TaxID=112525 RepID=A0AAD8FCU6_BIOPF|nr:hypothetical protein Bpfe_011489 [Biomphalaria pfeifferi]